jgi:integrase
MRWTELDLDAGVWTLPPERTKGNRLTRVPLTEQALAILRARRAAAREDAVFVFPSSSKPRTPISDPKHAFRRVLDRAGLPRDLRVHDLRRSAASFAVAAGVGLPVVQRLLNHANITTTSRVYAHLNLDSVRAALQSQHNALDERRNGNAPPLLSPHPEV